MDDKTTEKNAICEWLLRMTDDPLHSSGWVDRMAVFMEKLGMHRERMDLRGSARSVAWSLATDAINRGLAEVIHRKMKESCTTSNRVERPNLDLSTIQSELDRLPPCIVCESPGTGAGRLLLGDQTPFAYFPRLEDAQAIFSLIIMARKLIAQSASQS